MRGAHRRRHRGHALQRHLQRHREQPVGVLDQRGVRAGEGAGSGLIERHPRTRRAGAGREALVADIRRHVHLNRYARGGFTPHVGEANAEGHIAPRDHNAGGARHIQHQVGERLGMGARRRGTGAKKRRQCSPTDVAATVSPEHECGGGITKTSLGIPDHPKDEPAAAPSRPWHDCQKANATRGKRAPRRRDSLDYRCTGAPPRIPPVEECSSCPPVVPRSHRSTM